MSLCENCAYRGSIVPGSSHHISCKIGKQVKHHPIMLAIALRRLEGTVTGENGKTIIKVNKKAIERGWADWPMQFDPIWIEECAYRRAVFEITVSNYDRLWKAYNRAVANALPEFEFDGNEMLTSYAKYVLEYMETFPKIAEYIKKGRRSL